MKIRRFYESSEMEMSNESIENIISKLTEITSSSENKMGELTDIIKSLSKFKSNSSNSNTQIDDSCLNLDLVDKKLSEVINLLDTVINNLNDYKDSGEKYIY